MSIANEIERLQTAKETLKTKLNVKNDSEHQITNELISEYGNFVDNIYTGVDIDEYFKDTISAGTSEVGGWKNTQLKFRSPLTIIGNNAAFMFMNYPFAFIPTIDTSNVTNMRSMFYQCDSLTTMPQLNTNNVTNMRTMFYQCNLLTTIPQLDTSKVTDMQSMFNYCESLTTVPQLDASKVISIHFMFAQNRNLTNLGGLLNLGQAYLTTENANDYNYELDLNMSPKLTHESLMNVINGLYDIKTKGCNTQSLRLGSTNIAKLTSEEIAIATNKGWTVS